MTYLSGIACSRQRVDKKTRTPINSRSKREFDPRHPEQRQINNDQASYLYQNIKASNPNACGLYSVDASVTEEPSPTLKGATIDFLSLFFGGSLKSRPHLEIK